MKTALFYGDSITSAENNNFVGFVHKMHFDKLVTDMRLISSAVSGTTFGEYSIYPVDHLSCIEALYESEEQLQSSDMVFLEYGVNDATAVCLDYTTIQRVILDFRKCIDHIRQNSDAKIVFLALGPEDVIAKLGELQSMYITSEYLNDEFNVNPIQWAAIYEKIVRFAKMFCDDVWTMFNSLDEFTDNLDVDQLHPNDTGYSCIANNIASKIVIDM